MLFKISAAGRAAPEGQSWKGKFYNSVAPSILTQNTFCRGNTGLH